MSDHDPFAAATGGRDLFAWHSPPPREVDYAARARALMREWIAKARATPAGQLPWSPRTVRGCMTVAPQMTGWLSEEERAELLAQWEAELMRLGLCDEEGVAHLD